MFLQLLCKNANIANNAFDYNEVWYIIIGALIGLVSSIGIIVVERMMDRKGKLNIFYQILSNTTTKTLSYSFKNTYDKKVIFTIPVMFELQNTSNVPRVIRDLNFILCMDNIIVENMTQQDHVTTFDWKEDGTHEDHAFDFGTEKSSYSFVLEPRSIQKQVCLFTSVIELAEKDKKSFNSIVARYYDETNKPHYFKVANIENCWNKNELQGNGDWVLLSERIDIKKNSDVKK